MPISEISDLLSDINSVFGPVKSIFEGFEKFVGVWEFKDGEWGQKDGLFDNLSSLSVEADTTGDPDEGDAEALDGLSSLSADLGEAETNDDDD